MMPIADHTACSTSNYRLKSRAIADRLRHNAVGMSVCRRVGITIRSSAVITDGDKQDAAVVAAVGPSLSGPPTTVGDPSWLNATRRRCGVFGPALASPAMELWGTGTCLLDFKLSNCSGYFRTGQTYWSLCIKGLIETLLRKLTLASLIKHVCCLSWFLSEMDHCKWICRASTAMYSF